MAKTPTSCVVLIVGAGPSGLMMAAQLLRNGIQPVVIDSRKQPSQASKITVLDSRSLAILRQLGLDKSALQQGNEVDPLELHTEYNQKSLFDDPSNTRIQHPQSLILQQSKLEKLLIEYLTANTCPIYWNTSITSIQQTNGNTQANLLQDASPQQISCNWLIGADEIDGQVGKILHIPFIQASKTHPFYHIDLQLSKTFNSRKLSIWQKEENYFILIPSSNQQARLIGVLPKALQKREQISFNDLKPYLTYTFDFPLQTEQCLSFSSYLFHPQMAESIQTEHGFLIGEAAYANTALEEYGINTCFEDASNLAWKLSGVIQRYLPTKVLQSYSEERGPETRRLFQNTNRILSVFASDNSIIRWVRGHILPQLLPWILSKPAFKKKVLSFLAQRNTESYRNSRIAVHHSRLKEIKAGDPIPYIPFYDEKQAKETDLHQWCTKPGFTLMVWGTLSSRELFLIAKWITVTYPHHLNFYYLPYSPRNQHFFNRFEMTEKSKKTLIIRPDMYIGYISDAVVIEMMDTYLSETMGWIKKSES